ncbi:hypothetical protein I4U23_029352 [Adineta vaga]|nr:hypothetical protein I4U23_029352 [Adineta vaga]
MTSPDLAGGMTGADMGYASQHGIPSIDNITDWLALQGREQNGWTAIHFKRHLDTCDSMDVPIKSGTNHLIFAFGLVDPSRNPPNNGITYHQDRRGIYSLSLRSYSDPPVKSKFATMNYFDFRLNNACTYFLTYTIPTTDTVYHCKVHKAPAIYTTKRHVITHKILLNSTDTMHIHHLLMYECDPSARFNDSDLSSDICENIYNKIAPYMTNIATGWAVGEDLMSEFPPEAGYPTGNNFSVKYYVIQMHYSNPQLCTSDLSIPPRVQSFVVDTYCPASATLRLPTSGITVFSAFPHTHLQRRTVWTKLIRNKTAVEYLFNAEAYEFHRVMNSAHAVSIIQ